jgi:hypothetical protein
MNNNDIINLTCDIEYNNQKKKIMKKIFIQIENILNIFDTTFNDNIIKIYILYKKNKLNDEFNYLINLLYDFINEINNLKYIDQFEFLNIIFKIIKIYIIIQYIDNNINKYISITKYIEWQIIKNNIYSCIDYLLIHNKLIYNLIEINKLNYEDKKNYNNLKILIKSLANILCSDYFMYYTSTEILKILYKKLFINLNDISNKLSSNIIKFKKYFINEYRNKYNLYIDLYSEIKKYDISKYKLSITNNNFIELIIDLNSININL